MQKRQLKRLVETGHYRPDPGLIAEAMLERRGVRALLTGGVPVNAADRIQPPSTAPRQAA